MCRVIRQAQAVGQSVSDRGRPGTVADVLEPLLVVRDADCQVFTTVAALRMQQQALPGGRRGRWRRPPGRQRAVRAWWPRWVLHGLPINSLIWGWRGLAQVVRQGARPAQCGGCLVLLVCGAGWACGHSGGGSLSVANPWPTIWMGAASGAAQDRRGPQGLWKSMDLQPPLGACCAEPVAPGHGGIG